MKIAILFAVVCMTTCGISASVKNHNFMKSKGYDQKRDTIDIKPYEYLFYHKGYFPYHSEIFPENKIEATVSIKGFENTDTISIENLINKFELVYSEPFDSIKYGEIILKYGRKYYLKYFGSDICRTCNCDLSFAEVKKPKRKLNGNSLLLLWNVTVYKGERKYVVPSKRYWIK